MNMTSSIQQSKFQLLISKAMQQMKYPITRKSVKKKSSLFSVLSILPYHGVGALVRPVTYNARKNPDLSYYQITDSSLDMKRKKCRHVYGYRWYNGTLATRSDKPTLIKEGDNHSYWELFQRSELPPPHQKALFVEQAVTIHKDAKSVHKS